MVKTKISKDSWQASLARVLAHTNNPSHPARLAVVGIGNEQNGDDAAGVLIIRKITPLIEGNPGIQVFDAGQALENITGALIRYKPDRILFIDALSIDAKSGSVRMLDPQLSQGFSASTHSLPLSVVIQYLLHEHPCEVHLLGVQVRDTTPGTALSAEVERSVERITEEFTRLFQLAH
jgi:hydrogenase maturation protease HycI